MLVRGLLISALYNITSCQRLCSAISENIAFRWFCILSIDDRVFDHSTTIYFIDRVCNGRFGDILPRHMGEVGGQRCPVAARGGMFAVFGDPWDAPCRA